MSRDLEGVKAGDTIKANEQYGTGFVLHTVQRVTATRAVCTEASFMIDSGMQVGTRTTGRFSFARYGSLVNESDVATLASELDVKRRIAKATIQIDRVVVTADNLEAAEAFIAASKKPNSA